MPRQRAGTHAPCCRDPLRKKIWNSKLRLPNSSYLFVSRSFSRHLRHRLVVCHCFFVVKSCYLKNNWQSQYNSQNVIKSNVDKRCGSSILKMLSIVSSSRGLKLQIFFVPVLSSASRLSRRLVAWREDLWRKFLRSDRGCGLRGSQLIRISAGACAWCSASRLVDTTSARTRKVVRAVKISWRRSDQSADDWA